MRVLYVLYATLSSPPNVFSTDRVTSLLVSEALRLRYNSLVKFGLPEA